MNEGQVAVDAIRAVYSDATDVQAFMAATLEPFLEGAAAMGAMAYVLALRASELLRRLEEVDPTFTVERWFRVMEASAAAGGA